MNESYPVPPPELVQQWIRERDGLEHVVAKAARWGADQELEACCAYIGGEGRWFVNPEPRLAGLRWARRPKPPSLKQQALAALDSFEGFTGSLQEVDTIRRALEQLDD